MATVHARRRRYVAIVRDGIPFLPWPPNQDLEIAGIAALAEPAHG